MQTEKGKRAKSAEIGKYVPIIKNIHALNRQILINKLFKNTKFDLLLDYMIEMDAKNTAYYFIMENGLSDAFFDYCNEMRDCMEID